MMNCSVAKRSTKNSYIQLPWKACEVRGDGAEHPDGQEDHEGVEAREVDDGEVLVGEPGTKRHRQ